MKKIYEIPEVTIFEVGTCKQMIALSVFDTEQKATSSDEAEGNSNYMDDQSTPWYRR